jgi:hypothetical protein
MIVDHQGEVLKMRYQLPGTSVGDVISVTVWPGCDRSFDTCVNKFGNAANYGGFPYIPLNNPVTKVPPPTSPEEIPSGGGGGGKK